MGLHFNSRMIGKKNKCHLQEQLEKSVLHVLVVDDNRESKAERSTEICLGGHWSHDKKCIPYAQSRQIL